MTTHPAWIRRGESKLWDKGHLWAPRPGQRRAGRQHHRARPRALVCHDARARRHRPRDRRRASRPHCGWRPCASHASQRRGSQQSGRSCCPSTSNPGRAALPAANEGALLPVSGVSWLYRRAEGRRTSRHARDRPRTSDSAALVDVGSRRGSRTTSRCRRTRAEAQFGWTEMSLFAALQAVDPSRRSRRGGLQLHKLGVRPGSSRLPGAGRRRSASEASLEGLPVSGAVRPAAALCANAGPVARLRVRVASWRTPRRNLRRLGPDNPAARHSSSMRSSNASRPPRRSAWST